MRYYELTNTPRPTKPEEQSCTVRLIVSRLQLNELYRRAYELTPLR